jgi:Rps23 Pro-64 3,4-dihydroxylase Tpa1-like proline 4-hydroxylase
VPKYIARVYNSAVDLGRGKLADSIVDSLSRSENAARQEFRISNRIPSFSLDNLLPDETADAIHRAFPPTAGMVLKKTLGQLKYVGYQMSDYNPLLEEIIYAFQDSRLLDLISRITGIAQLLPDENLYAGGISLMAQGHYLNPHLDNSHDIGRANYRALNLLYYVTPGWRDDFGGHLELWDRGPGYPQRTLHSRFNRLVVMQTDERSWHSVSKVVHPGNRCCVSNYYFSPRPVGKDASYHVTSFRGWPQQKAADLVMRADNALRLVVRKVGGNWLFRNPHVYRKPKERR